MKKTLTLLILTLVTYTNTYAYIPSELDFEWNKWDTYYNLTRYSSFEKPNFYDAWDLATGKWIKIAVIDSFENNYYHWIWIESLISSSHNDWWIVGYAPGAEVVRYNYCSASSCRYGELVWILDKIKERWDIKIVNISTTYRNKDFSAKLKELADSGIMIVTTLNNKVILANSYHCEDNSIICVWSYYTHTSFKDWTWYRFKSNFYHNIINTTEILGKWFYPEMLDSYGWTHRKTWTSFAAPQVSSLIALMLEVNPNLTYEQVRSIIIETWDELDKWWDVAINAYKAVQKAKEVNWEFSPTTPIEPTPIEESWDNNSEKEVVTPPTVTPTPVTPSPWTNIDLELATRIIQLEKRLTDQNTEIIKLKAQIKEQEERLTWVEKIVKWIRELFY